MIIVDFVYMVDMVDLVDMGDMVDMVDYLLRASVWKLTPVSIIVFKMFRHQWKMKWFLILPSSNRG